MYNLISPVGWLLFFFVAVWNDSKLLFKGAKLITDHRK